MLSAEIEAVPAGRTRDFGLDRSMLLGYGHDDRVCAYASLRGHSLFGGRRRSTPAAACWRTRKKSAAWARLACRRAISKTPWRS